MKGYKIKIQKPIFNHKTASLPTIFNNKNLFRPARNFREGSLVGYVSNRIPKKYNGINSNSVLNNDLFTSRIYEFLRDQINMKIMNASKYQYETELKAKENQIKEKSKRLHQPPILKHRIQMIKTETNFKLIKMKRQSIDTNRNFNSCCLGTKYLSNSILSNSQKLVKLKTNNRKQNEDETSTQKQIKVLPKYKFLFLKKHSRKNPDDLLFRTNSKIKIKLNHLKNDNITCHSTKKSRENSVMESWQIVSKGNIVKEKIFKDYI